MCAPRVHVLCSARSNRACAPRSRAAVLYALFSTACLCAALLLLAEVFNHPFGIKVRRRWPLGSRRGCMPHARPGALAAAVCVPAG